jgi:hypothetical protein
MFDDEKTVMFWRYEAPWTWDEYYQAQDAAWKMLDTVKYKVDGIMDMSQSFTLPSGAMTHSREALAHAHANTGLVVIVGANHFLRAIFNLLNTVYNPIVKKVNIVMVSTLQEAYVLIRKHQARSN